ncbi:MAG: DUF4831 family protein [Bacteroidales bacterium]|nr:DUF4831 family protein [Bacteroidales bacterium]MBQ2502655.1 DUF4831 family protein [Bacteroidales bacterium]MBQ3985177.1 DUF4831 family protein [Bacteroidales bacterium]MBQ4189916.1 DUF4831 family protein [Bacteroidales bacterium]MBQ7072021.1 DUF4831 family protein [Bacteroidales bacterium]
MIKRFFVAAAALLCCIGAGAQQVQPKTKLTFDVSAQLEQFYAGPYARYAQKYLGVEAKEEDSSKATLTSVVMKYGSDTEASGTSVWSKPGFAQSGFESRGVSANYTSEAATLFSAGAASRIVSQSVTVEKTPEQKAREAADMVFLLRRNRIQIITGDTDATYSGEAMKAAIDELAALEQEYLSLFLGYTITQEQKVTFELSPSSDAKDQIYVIFRLSDQEGLLPAEEIGGKPYYLDIAPQEMASAPAADPRAASRAKAVQTVRIPAICDLKVSDGVKTFLQSRIPVYQLGEDRVYPVQ